MLKKFFAAHPHIKLAIIIAPFLMIGSYILTDYFLSQPVADPPWQALQFKADCYLLQHEVCQIVQRNIAVNLLWEKQQFYLSSSIALKGALLGIDDQQPQSLQPRDASGKRWRLPLSLQGGESLKLALVSADKSFYMEWIAQ